MLKVLCDMDPGHDDALALLVALKVVEVVGVTTVAGNQTLRKTTVNARRVLRAAEREDIRVAPGRGQPLFYPLVTAGEIHGESGLDGYSFPVLPELIPMIGANELLECTFSKALEPIDWIATGPLSNVAAFLLGHPHLFEGIGTLSIMGGSLGRGNITDSAEFNIFVDPDAADIVMHSGLNIRMAGLDVTHKALLTPDAHARFRELADPIGEMLFALFSFYGSREVNAGRQGAPIHDVLAVAALVEPDLFNWQKTPLIVHRQGECRGATRRGQDGPYISVAVDIDVQSFFEWFWQALDQYR